MKKSCKETLFAKSYYRLYKASLFSNKFKWIKSKITNQIKLNLSKYLIEILIKIRT